MVLLFHPNDIHVLKKIRSFLDNYFFKIHMKWVVVNTFLFISVKAPSM